MCLCTGRTGRVREKTIMHIHKYGRQSTHRPTAVAEQLAAARASQPGVESLDQEGFEDLGFVAFPDTVVAPGLVLRGCRLAEAGELYHSAPLFERLDHSFPE